LKSDKKGPTAPEDEDADDFFSSLDDDDDDDEEESAPPELLPRPARARSGSASKEARPAE
jgi:hypothetical protein